MLRQQRINQYAVVILVFVSLFVVFVSGCPQQEQKSETQTDAKEEIETTTPEAVIKPAEDSEETEAESEPTIAPENAIAVIETEKGNIEFEFYATDAPQASKNFIKNASLGYYRNESFHRVEELIIQAGSTFIDGTLPIEKSAHALEKGVVLMAKKEGASVSDAGEFFICKDAIALEDGDYTTLGKVIKGLEVLASIEKDDKIVNITIRERNKE